jgi:rubredoxin
MTAADIVLVEWDCRYCGHTIHPERGERAIGTIAGRTLRYRHIVCPAEYPNSGAERAGKVG